MVTRTPSRATSLLALLAAAVLLLAACGDDSGDSASSDTTAPPADGATTTTVASEEPPSESPAASLRSDLTALLEEQVYLTGFTVEEAVAAGGDPQAPSAAATADAAADSSAELGEIIGGAYGVEAGLEFTEVWDAYRESIVDQALAGGGADEVTAAREEVVTTLGSFDPSADFDAVAAGLEAAEEALLTTVEEMAAGTEGAILDLRAAAEEMPFVALDLATIIAENGTVEGEVDSAESALRADLTGLMQESALLTGLALTETVQAGGDANAPGPTDVFAAVDENTAALADLIFPDDVNAANAFTRIWGDHIESFEDYTVAKLGDDAEGIQDAEAALVRFRDDIGALLADRYPALTMEAVAEELVGHTDSMLAYADAVVAEEPVSGSTVPAASGGPTTTTVPAPPGGPTTTTVPPEGEGPTADEAEPTDPEAPGLLREAALAMRLAARTFAGGLTAPVAE